MSEPAEQIATGSPRRRRVHAVVGVLYVLVAAGQLADGIVHPRLYAWLLSAGWAAPASYYLILWQRSSSD